jgi:hypothetical protein
MSRSNKTPLSLMGGGVFCLCGASFPEQFGEIRGLPALISFSHDLPPDSAGQI